MKKHCLKSEHVRSFIFIITIFLLLALGIIQPHASEKVVRHANSNALVKNKLIGSSPMLLGANKLTDILSRLGNLKEKLQLLKQNPKSNNPAFHLQYTPPLFREVLRRQPRNLKSKQMHFMGEIHRLKKSKRSAARVSVIQANDEAGSIRGTITCAGCSESEIVVSAHGDVPGPSAPILGETTINSPGGTYEITDLPLDAEIWVSAWWNKPGTSPFPDCGDYYGEYEANPIILTEINPNLEGRDITIEEISITGQITCPYFGEGQIQVSAWDGEVGQSNVIGLMYINSAGYYFMTNLPHDTEIWIAAWWDKEQQWIGTPDSDDYFGLYEENPINLRDDEPCLPGINISLYVQDGGTISGTITECDTEPPVAVENVEVYALDWDMGGMMFYGWSDSEGHYNIQELPAGNYQVCVDNHDTKYIKICHDTPVEVTAGSNTPLDLCLEVGGSIYGEIICTGCGEGPIKVWALDSEPGSWSETLASTTINSAGPYTIRGAPFDTEVWVAGWWNMPGSNNWPDYDDYFGEYQENPIILTKADPNRTGIDISLEKIIITNPPVITSSPVTTAAVNVPYSYDVEADSEVALAFSLNTAPSGMNIDEEIGLITWTPTIFQLGNHSVEVQVEDEYEQSDTQEFVIHVSLFPWCPMSLALENEKDLNIIRKFRDKRLSSTPLGQDYINLFYKHSDEVTLILLLNSDLIPHTANVAGKLLPLVDPLIEGESIYVNTDTIKEIDSLLDGIETQASPSLKADIKRIKKDISSGEIFKQLGITIGE